VPGGEYPRVSVYPHAEVLGRELEYVDVWQPSVTTEHEKVFHVLQVCYAELFGFDG